MSAPNLTKKLEKVLVISPTAASEIIELLMEHDFKIVKREPDFIVCFGGDGTVLLSERNFPGVPKLLVKNTNIGRKFEYSLYHLKNILHKISDGRYEIQREIKIETEVKNEKLVGLNEIQIHNKLPIYAVRFSLAVNGKKFESLIGDGVVIATPFGSTGYYKSTGGKPFKKGIGISFNNLHNKNIKSFVVSENSVVKVKINRGPAWVLADNYEKFFELKDNDTVTIRKSKSIANFICVP